MAVSGLAVPGIQIGGWLLERQAPRVHVAEVVVAPLPPERPFRGPAFQDEIVALLEALAVVDRVRVRPPRLDADPAHEAREYAAARDQIRHRELLGHPHRVVL